MVEVGGGYGRSEDLANEAFSIVISIGDIDVGADGVALSCGPDCDPGKVF
jgi:hypothetical protein